MGDVVSLVEKAAEEIDEKEAMRMAKRFEEAKFDFNDFLGQMRFMKKLGPLEGILGMLPGMGKLKELGGAVNDKRMKHVEAMVLSMTPGERSRPEILNGSRRKRIATGSGRSVTEVNQLVKQFDMMRQLMKNKGAMAQIAGGLMGGGAPGGKMPGLGGMPGMGGMPGLGGFPGMKGGRPKLGGGKFKRPRLGG
jgi:signal recognition particle subunit SRP54